MKRMEKAKNEVGLIPRIFLAVVEDNNDPQHRGRLRVRVIGLHTEIKNESSTEGILTEHLLWADPVLPPMGGGITGRGTWPDAPEKGSLVVLFFLDGSEFQTPFYFGVLGGSRRLEANPSIGFNDPDGLWPRKDRVPNDETIPGNGDAPYHKDESRKTLGETYFDVIREDIEEDNPDPIEGAFGKDEWEESGPNSQPEARYNWTEEHHPRDYESEDRHYRHGYIREIDSTPDREGVREYYARSASYRQVDGGGEEKLRFKGGREHVIFQKDREQVKGFKSVVVEGERYVLVHQDAFNEFKQDLEEKMENMRQEVANLKRVQADTVTHHVNRHNLDADDNSVLVNNIVTCPLIGAHSSQNKVFCSP
jgi:hypothetical protein